MEFETLIYEKSESYTSDGKFRTALKHSTLYEATIIRDILFRNKELLGITFLSGIDIRFNFSYSRKKLLKKFRVNYFQDYNNFLLMDKDKYNRIYNNNFRNFFFHIVSLNKLNMLEIIKNNSNLNFGEIDLEKTSWDSIIVKFNENK